MLRRINAAMLRQAGVDRARFATVVHGQLSIDGDGARVCLVGAGHLPALVLRGDTVEVVPVPGTLLGIYRDIELTEVDI